MFWEIPAFPAFWENLSIPRCIKIALGFPIYIIRNITISLKKKDQKSERLSNEPETTQLEKPSWHSNEALSGWKPTMARLSVTFSPPTRGRMRSSAWLERIPEA